MNEQQTTENGLPEASGYDWLLNKCCDLDQAAHTGHLDEGEYEPTCIYCRTGEGRPRVTSPEVTP